MIFLKANAELKNVYQKMINTMREDVKWDGIIMFHNNKMVLVGELGSLFYDFDLKKVYSNIVDITVDKEHIFDMKDSKLLTNIINMLLYAFGKWGAIRGLKVDQDYARLSALFSQILKEIDIEPYYTNLGFKFFRNGLLITFEEVIIVAEEEITKQQNEIVKSQVDQGEMDDDDFTLGLWHNVQWKAARREVSSEAIDKNQVNAKRIGHNFYMVKYKCPECERHLHMVVYPEGSEYLIDTDDGKVYLARAYECSVCKKFYTPRPDKLLKEGEVYELDFDDDVHAADDYQKLIGEKGARTFNCNFNMYESDYKEKKNEVRKSLAELCRHLDELTEEELEEIMSKMEEGFYSEVDIERFLAVIEQELAYRRSRESQRQGMFGDNARDEDDGNAISVHSEMTVNSETPANSETSAKSAMPANDSSAFEPNLVAVSTDEGQEKSKTIIKDEKSAIKAQKSTIKDKKSAIKKENYIKRNKNAGVSGGTTSHDDTTSNNDAKSDNGAISGSDATSSNNTKKRDKLDKSTNTTNISGSDGSPSIDLRTVMDKKIDASRSAKYDEIGQIISEVEKSDLADDEKASYVKKLKGIRYNAAKSEIEYIISHLPDNINKERYLRTKEQIKKYKDIDLKPYDKIIDAKRDKVEYTQINDIVSIVNKINRSDILSAIESINNGGFQTRNSKPFLDSLNKMIREMDEAAIERICPDIAEMSFEDGLAALNAIQDGDFLPELKSNMLQLIDKRLTKMKSDECEQLVKKLRKDFSGKVLDYSKIHFYDVRKMLRGDNKDKESSMIRLAISTYATAAGKYEYPLMIVDSSVFGSGKEGIILTPDHIFYKGLFKSGSIDVNNIESIEINGGTKGKGIVAVHKSAGKVKLPSSLGSSDEKGMAQVLDAFVKYLKLKPESRSISYLSKENHQVKCCYRCGHVFTEGNICHKCGSRNK